MKSPSCRAIYDCPIPIISGVGHEIDVTLADLAADVRALTPSEAAERLVPDQREIDELILGLRNRMQRAIVSQLQNAKSEVDAIARRPVLARPLDRLMQSAIELDGLENRMTLAIKNKTKNCQLELAESAARLEALNPLAVLTRGFSLTSTEAGQLISQIDAVQIGQTMTTRLTDGTITSTVDSVSKLPMADAHPANKNRGN